MKELSYTKHYRGGALDSLTVPVKIRNPSQACVDWARKSSTENLREDTHGLKWFAQNIREIA